MENLDITLEELKEAQRKLQKKTKQLEKFEKARKAKEHIRETVKKKNESLFAEVKKEEDKEISCSGKMVRFKSGSPDVIILNKEEDQYDDDSVQILQHTQSLDLLPHYTHSLNDQATTNSFEEMEQTIFQEVKLRRRVNSLKERRQKFSPETSGTSRNECLVNEEHSCADSIATIELIDNKEQSRCTINVDNIHYNNPRRLNVAGDSVVSECVNTLSIIDIKPCHITEEDDTYNINNKQNTCLKTPEHYSLNNTCDSHNISDLSCTEYGEVLRSCIIITSYNCDQYYPCVVLLHPCSFSLWTEREDQEKSCREWQCIAQERLHYNFITSHNIEMLLGFNFSNDVRFAAVITCKTQSDPQLLYIQRSDSDKPVEVCETLSNIVAVCGAVINDWSIIVSDNRDDSTLNILDIDPVFSRRHNKWNLQIVCRGRRLLLGIKAEDICPVNYPGSIAIDVLLIKEANYINLYDINEQVILYKLPTTMDNNLLNCDVLLTTVIKNMVSLVVKTQNSEIITKIINNDVSQGMLSLNIDCCPLFRSHLNKLCKWCCAIINSTVYFLSERGNVSRLVLPKE